MTGFLQDTPFQQRHQVSSQIPWPILEGRLSSTREAARYWNRGYRVPVASLQRLKPLACVNGPIPVLSKI